MSDIGARQTGPAFVTPAALMLYQFGGVTGHLLAVGRRLLELAFFEWKRQ